MDIKKYFISIGIAAAISLALTCIFALISAISWIVLWAVLVFLLVPLGFRVIDFWKEHQCYDLDSFFTELSLEIKKRQKEPPKHSNIEW